MNIVTVVSIGLGILLLIGFLLGFLRSWQKALIRLVLIVVSFLTAFLLSSKISTILMDKFVDGLVVSIFGLTLDFESIAGDIAGDLFSESSSLTNLASAIMNIFIKLIAFLIIFVSMLIVTLIIYYIISAIMSGRRKKKSVGNAKPKGWERIIGGVIGMIASLVVSMVIFTPVFGVMNVCDKFLEDETPAATASSYVDNGLICGKFYTEDEKIGKVEGYLEKYDKLRTEYKNSFAGVVFKCTGVDAIGKSVFNKLSTVNKNGVNVNLTTECVNVVKVYNLYKINFIENQFDLSKDSSVEAIESIYGIAKESEVMRSIVVDLVPKMASKWINGEKFLGMEIPVSGDMQEIVIELLKVFNTDDFNTIDRNLQVTFPALKIANKYGVISDINNGSSLMDVIDRDGFVREEINNLATTAEFRQVLPNMLTTTIKIVYRAEIGDPADRLDQDFSQEQIAQIVWKDEADVIQKIVLKITKITETEEIIDSFGDFGEVIDLARESKVLSKPVKIFMQDYIISTSLNENTKAVLIDAFKDDNWNSTSYSYTDLFKTIQVTAKVAKNSKNIDFTDIPLDTLLKNDKDGKVKKTLQQAVNAGVIDDLVEDKKKAAIYKDLMKNVLSDDNAGNVDDDIKAGEVVDNIINKSNETDSMFGEDKNAEANKSVEELTKSDAVMELLKTEAEKTEAGEQSDIKDYIDGMNEADKDAFKNAINGMSAESEKEIANKNALSKLFGVS